MYMDPDCLVAYTDLLKNMPSLRGNASEIKAKMSESCETFVDDQVTNEACTEAVTMHTGALVNKNMSKREWFEYLRSMRVGPECERVSMEMYDKVVRTVCDAHVTNKTRGKSNE